MNWNKTVFSPCRRYRYSLWRNWSTMFGGTCKYAMIIGLNPSTADETTDDPTIRRCVAFAKYWGYGALCMTNLFAFRATDPGDMKRTVDPVGPENNHALGELAKSAGVIVAAWGVHGSHKGRDREVKRMIPNLHYFRLTKHGHPQHPLYLPRNLSPIPWTEDAPSQPSQDPLDRQ